jgi:hypothetical protein
MTNTFNSKYKPDDLVEFYGDSRSIGCVLAVTFDGNDQIFYHIHDMDYREDGSSDVYKSIEDANIIRKLKEDEDIEESIKICKLNDD